MIFRSSMENHLHVPTNRLAGLLCWGGLEGDYSPQPLLVCFWDRPLGLTMAQFQPPPQNPILLEILAQKKPFFADDFPN